MPVETRIAQEYDPELILKYGFKVAREFEARLNRIRVFVPDHNLTSGTANEAILRSFLREHSSARFGVGEGFIRDPMSVEEGSRQCDILVYDTSYPRVYVDGDVSIVFPKAVKMLIEVKTRLGKNELHGAVENIASAMRLNHYIRSYVFAFGATHIGSLRGHLKQSLQKSDMGVWPFAFLLFEPGILIHRWTVGETDWRDTPFQVLTSNSSEDGKAIVVSFLLLQFIELQMNGLWGGSSISNALGTLLTDSDFMRYHGLRSEPLM